MQIKRLTCIALAFSTQCLIAETRQIDGRQNNLNHPDWGAAKTPVQRFAPYFYNDGVSEMAGNDRPNPRYISNIIVSQPALTESRNGLSDMTWCWGQFLDHDIALTLPTTEEFIPVMVEAPDLMFPMIPVMRSDHDPSTGINRNNPREQVNSTTSFIDGSAVYGSSLERVEALRVHEGGRLLTNDGDLLPWNTALIEMENPDKRPLDQLFMAGDVRANENPALISMQTLWLREHNYWADTLAEQHPGWDDETLFQHARRMVMGEIQAVTFQEFLPTLLGPHAPDISEAHYDPDMDPRMFNEVLGALFRIGHTMVSTHIMQLNADGSAAGPGEFEFKEAFFKPELMNGYASVQRVLKGVASKRMQEIDPFVVDDLRNFLFGQPGAGGLDLISINLQRGRDHGLPSYNEARLALGLTERESFEEISGNPDLVEVLTSAYGEVRLVDLWVGAMAEDHLADANVGETLAVALSMQFSHLRDGDRFFFTHDEGLSASEKTAIRATSLSQVIVRNTGLASSDLQANVFIAPPVSEWHDGDNDGVADIREVIAGTDPDSVTSQLRITSVIRSRDAHVLSWSSVADQEYLVQFASSLGQSTTWQTIATVTGIEGQQSHTHALTAGTQEGYYRIAVGR